MNDEVSGVNGAGKSQREARLTQPGAGLTRRECLGAALGTVLGVAAGTALAMPAFAGVRQPEGTKGASAPQPGTMPQKAEGKELGMFKISLAQWSLHKALFAGQLDHLDFPKAAKQDYGIDAVEYVNVFFKQKQSKEYLKELKSRCDDLGVRSVLIMCDGEGRIGDPEESKRALAVENHHKWVEAAKFLGCHSIRVNAQSEGTPEDQMSRAADGLRQLCEFGDLHGINVIVENHGGLSSNGEWLAGVMKMCGHKRVGTLPDFGNFRVSETETYDMYKGVTEMMPWAKGVSAKSHDFDERGEETKKDYRRLMKIVRDAGYHGRVGIEYEGDRLSEPDGIRATKRLLETILAEWGAEGR